MAYWRLRKRTEKYRQAVGQPFKEVSDELIDAEEQHNKLEAELKKLRDGNAPEEAIAEAVLDLGVVNVRYRRLVAEFNE